MGAMFKDKLKELRKHRNLTQEERLKNFLLRAQLWQNGNKVEDYQNKKRFIVYVFYFK